MLRHASGVQRRAALAATALVACLALCVASAAVPITIPIIGPIKGRWIEYNATQSSKIAAEAAARAEEASPTLEVERP